MTNKAGQKVALVTGASRGIGKQIARVLSQKGYALAIHYGKNQDAAANLAAELPNSQIFGCPLEDEAAIGILVKEVKAHFGSIDLLINNAGRAIDQVVTFAKPSDFQTLINTNLMPVFLLSKLISRQMIKQKSGNIINITSVVGHTGNGGQAMYAATKSAITGFTQSIAMDLAGFGIRCNCVAPGFIQTDMTDELPEDVKTGILSQIPLKRLGQTEEVANAVAFLASEAASYITGTTLHVNGGMYRN